MTTRREYDLLNRRRHAESLSTATNTLGLVVDYQYNQANQRERIDNGDGTPWAIEYDDLGQVVGSKKYWPDGSAVPRQQFEYDFDDIGNRTARRYGGDALGQSSKLRQVNSSRKDGVEDAASVGWGASEGFGGRGHGLDQFPLGVGEVRVEKGDV
jgi:YD repeat-containing protein